MFGRDPFEIKDGPEGIFRNRVSLEYRILEKRASEPLMWSPFPPQLLHIRQIFDSAEQFVEYGST